MSMLRNLLLFLLMAFSSISTYSSNLVNSMTPEHIVGTFYKSYLSDDSGHNKTLIKEYVSDSLLKSITDSSRCNYDSDDSMSEVELQKICGQKHLCKQYKGNYICDWYGIGIESDVNYFTKSQDVYPSWQSNIEAKVISQTVKKATVKVRLGNGSEPILNLIVTLKQDPDAWKITSVAEY